MRDIVDLGTAGDPISGKLWYRSTTERVASDLNVLGYQISDRSVSRLLKSMGYSLWVNHKQISRTQHPDRDLQFQMIGVLRALYSLLGYPIVSVDALRRIIVGLFWNKGVAWRKKAIKVFDHDYPSWGSGVANSYGVYDLLANKGAFYVGLSYNTPQFAVDSITRWWETVGWYRYPSAKELLILADSGGSNGYRSRAWKYFLQHQLSTPFGLNVTVAHYPSGASKWNPIEHRLFSEASKRWAGIPLDSIKTILNGYNSSTTKTGLTATSEVLNKVYPRGIKISDKEMEKLNLDWNENLPQWNYALKSYPSNEKRDWEELLIG